jgi:hypothetical protein
MSDGPKLVETYPPEVKQISALAYALRELRGSTGDAAGQQDAADAAALEAILAKLRRRIVSVLPGDLTLDLAAIGQEVMDAEAKWPPMNSAHEAYAVLLEEVDELWAHVKTNQNRRDIPAMRQEAVQVAAMAVRFVRDVCDGGRGRA